LAATPPASATTHANARVARNADPSPCFKVFPPKPVQEGRITGWVNNPLLHRDLGGKAPHPSPVARMERLRVKDAQLRNPGTHPDYATRRRFAPTGRLHPGYKSAVAAGRSRSTKTWPSRTAVR
jgi:hypothetical protein